MTNAVVLDNDAHSSLRVDIRFGVEFGDSVNQVRAFPTEFVELQREYAIFFRRAEDETYRSVALLGLDRDENLFLEGAHWNARYVPAVQARGPFSIGLRRSETAPDMTGEPIIKFHPDDARIGPNGQEALFLPHGGAAPYLEHISAILRTLHAGVALEQSFFSTLTSFDLIEPVTAEIKLSDTEQYTLPGLFSIHHERFEALGGDALLTLHKSGALQLCHMVMASHSNTSRLIDMKRRKQATA